MYEQDISVADSDHTWEQTDVILKECGDHWTLTQAHEKNFWYGGKRRKKKYADGKVLDLKLGRSSEASNEQKEKNAFRIQSRRNAMIRDLMNCNEGVLQKFETLTGHGNYKDLGKANNDRKKYFDRLERFVRSGNLFGKKVKGFVSIEKFKLKVLGVVEFQDGHRRKDGGSTGNVHFHHFTNAPYIPRVWVVAGKLRNQETGELSEFYLGKGDGRFFWMKAAGRISPWFNDEADAKKFIRRCRAALPAAFNIHPKELCVDALLWEKGHTKIKKLKDLRKQGKLSNAGEYLCQYVGKGVDERLRGRHGWYKRGRLEKPTVYRNPDTIRRAILELDLWKYLVKEIHFVAEFIGAMSKWYFNFWVEEYPWIRILYERKEQGLKMSPADWIACGVCQSPLLC
jgi:hypothetical protein